MTTVVDLERKTRDNFWTSLLVDVVLVNGDSQIRTSEAQVTLPRLSMCTDRGEICRELMCYAEDAGLKGAPLCTPFPRRSTMMSKTSIR